jgi:hypothetical protein
MTSHSKDIPLSKLLKQLKTLNSGLRFALRAAELDEQLARLGVTDATRLDLSNELYDITLKKLAAKT